MVKSADELAKNGVYFHVNEDDMMNVYAMFVGREKTPYHHGFYFIKFTYPSMYTMAPTKAHYATQGQIFGRGFRFNPNLYVCGKVWLSMLGTWSGPGWMPVNTIINVFMAVQALVLNDYPVKNEPGYANHSDKSVEVANYNRVVEYANIKVGILEMMENPPKDFAVFKPVMEKYFVENYDSIVENVKQYQEIVGKSKGMVSCSYAHVSGTCDYDVLLGKLEKKMEALSGSSGAGVGASATPAPPTSIEAPLPAPPSAPDAPTSEEKAPKKSAKGAKPTAAPTPPVPPAPPTPPAPFGSTGSSDTVFKMAQEYGVDLDPEIIIALGNDPEALQAAILMAKSTH